MAFLTGNLKNNGSGDLKQNMVKLLVFFFHFPKVGIISNTFLVRLG